MLLCIGLAGRGALTQSIHIQIEFVVSAVWGQPRLVIYMWGNLTYPLEVFVSKLAHFRFHSLLQRARREGAERTTVALVSNGNT